MPLALRRTEARYQSKVNPFDSRGGLHVPPSPRDFRLQRSSFRLSETGTVCDYRPETVPSRLGKPTNVAIRSRVAVSTSSGF